MTSQTPPDVLLEEEEEDDAHAGEIPLTMAASVVLDHLPLDAHQALEGAGDLAFAKGELIYLSSYSTTAIFCFPPGVCGFTPHPTSRMIIHSKSSTPTTLHQNSLQEHSKQRARR